MVTHLTTRTGRYTGILLLAASLGLPAAAQDSTGPVTFPQPSTGRGIAPGSLEGTNTAPDPEQSHMLRKMVKERNMIRQQLIVDDTNRLLDLAKQLKDAVDKSNKNELSLSVVTTAAEIEKLAKTVKEKMRDGQ
jgi:hypothetical protein